MILHTNDGRVVEYAIEKHSKKISIVTQLPATTTTMETLPNNLPRQFHKWMRNKSLEPKRVITSVREEVIPCYSVIISQDYSNENNFLAITYQVSQLSGESQNQFLLAVMNFHHFKAVILNALDHVFLTLEAPQQAFLCELVAKDSDNWAKDLFKAIRQLPSKDNQEKVIKELMAQWNRREEPLWLKFMMRSQQTDHQNCLQDHPEALQLYANISQYIDDTTPSFLHRHNSTTRNNNCDAAKWLLKRLLEGPAEPAAVFKRAFKNGRLKDLCDAVIQINPHIMQTEIPVAQAISTYFINDDAPLAEARVTKRY